MFANLEFLPIPLRGQSYWNDSFRKSLSIPWEHNRFIILSCKVAILRNSIVKFFLHFELNNFPLHLSYFLPFLIIRRRKRLSKWFVPRFVEFYFFDSEIVSFYYTASIVLAKLHYLQNFIIKSTIFLCIYIYFHIFFHSLPLILKKKNHISTKNFQT